MAEPHITLDPHGLNPVGEKLRGPLEDQLTSALRAATDRVRSDYAGEPAAQVSDELLEQTRAGLHPDIAAAFHPDPDDLHKVAEAIVEHPAR